MLCKIGNVGKQMCSYTKLRVQRNQNTNNYITTQFLPSDNKKEAVET